jgi:hypothetical protein
MLDNMPKKTHNSRLPESPAATAGLYWGFAKLVKASDSESDMRRFESYIPSQIRQQYIWGFAKLVKAPDFDSGMRRFESYIPSHLTKACTRTCFYFYRCVMRRNRLPENKRSTFRQNKTGAKTGEAGIFLP